MVRPKRNTVKRAAENVEVNSKKKKKDDVKQTVKKIKAKNDDGSDSGSSSDEFVRIKTEPGPLKLKEECKAEPDFSAIENSIFDGVTRLSDSDSDSDFEEVNNKSPLLPVAVTKVKAEVAEADSVSEEKIKPRTKLQLSKLRKNVLKRSKATEDEESSDSCPLQQKKDSKDKIKAKAGLDRDSAAVKTTREGKKVSQNLKNRDDEEETDSAKRNSRKKGPGVKGKKETVNSKKDATDSKTKSTADLAKTGKDAKSAKKVENDSKSKAKKPSKSTDKNQVPSTSVQMKAESVIPKDIDSMDMNELLALGENLGLKPISQTGQSGSEHSDEENDWEEVNANEAEEKKHVIPKEGVQITLEMPDFIRRRRKKREDLEAQMNRQLNRVRREFQILFHKVSVLSWLAHGFYINGILNNEELLAVALSLIPSNHCLPAEQIDLKYVKMIVEWFAKLVDYSENFTHIDDDHDMPIKVETIQKQFARRVAKSKRELVFMFLCILRAVGVDARLVISLQPMPLKPQSSDLMPIKASKEKQGRKPVKKERSPSPEKKKASSPEKKSSKKDELSTSKKTETSRKTATKRKAEEPVKNGPSPRKTRSSAARKSYKEQIADSESEEDSKPLMSRKGDNSKRKSDEPLLSPKKKVLSEDDKEKLKKAAESRNPRIRRSIAARIKDEKDFEPKEDESESEEGDSDFTPESRKKRKQVSPKVETKKASPKVEAKKETRKPRVFSGEKKGKKVLSSSEDEKHRSLLTKKMGCDYWIEVYVHKEDSWIPLDITRGKVDCVDEIKARATHPILYVIAWNRDNTVKDVTRRYVSQYSQVTAKQRADEKWWEKTIKRFRPKSTAIDKEEDGQLHMAQLNRPMPKSVAECKNHPLYVLKRHLLKFQAIYPPDAPTLGFVRGEPLYARQNVYTLHSREIWIKEAKVVRPGEKPYKIVKARPKYDRMSGNVITDLPLEVFGPWQTQDYEPPTAVDGKVPRNAYGNVELFKPSMVPKGCVHLQVPSLNRVAKKLQIDCAPAVVGFDYHCGGSHPTFDGYVVCEEYVDILMDAWNKEIDESAKRQREKDEKRIYGNWRRLIKGLLIREHINFRYDFKEDDPDNEPVDTKRNEIALAEARLSQETAPIHSVFPKLMAKVRSSNRGRKTAGPSSSGSRKPAAAGSKPKGRQRRRKKESSSEEEEESGLDSTTSEEDVNMVLLSDEDSGSDEFDEKSEEEDDE